MTSWFLMGVGMLLIHHGVRVGWWVLGAGVAVTLVSLARSDG